MVLDIGVRLFRGFKPNALWVLIVATFIVHIIAEDIDADIKFIKKAISLTPLQRFTNYPVLVQEIKEDQTIYRHFVGGAKPGGVVFRRNGSDLHKSSVILNELEDHLTYTRENEDNRIYIVLIQNPVREKYYHVVYAYARNVPPEDVVDNSVIIINRDKRRIEWDVWDQRGANKNKATSFGWTTCLESFLIPCKPFFPESSDAGFHDYSGESDDKKLTGAKSAKYVGISDDRIAFKTENGLDAGMNFDFFGDLDDNNEQALMVGSIVDTITDTVQFFAETAKKFGESEDLNLNDADSTIKAVQTFMSQDFVKLLLLDLKNIGNHSYRAMDNKERDMGKLIGEGYRVLQGLLNNSDSDQLSEKLMIDVFAEETGRKPALKGERSGGRTTNRGKAKALVSANDSDHSFKSKWKGFGHMNIDDLLESLSDAGRKRRQMSYPANAAGMGQLPYYNTGPANQQRMQSTNPQMKAQGQGPAGYKLPNMIQSKSGGLVAGEDWRIKCARPNLSAGEKGWCGCHVGKEVSWGTSEALGDTVSQVLSGKKITDDPSIFDPLFNNGVGTFFCGGGAALFDIADQIAKPFGLSGIVSAASQLTGTVAGISGGGPVLVGHLIHQGVKAIGQTTGLGGLIGMKGSGGGPFGGAGRGIGLGLQKSKEVLPDVETDVEIFGHLGWRTQDVEDLQDLANDQFTSSFSSQPFIGMGTCPYVPVTVTDFEKANTLLDVAKLYHTVLRTQCLEKQAALLEDLVDEGHLHLNDDKTMSISDHSPSVKNTVLTERQIDRLSLAFSFAIFSQVYAEEFGNATKNPVNPEGVKISRPVHVMVQYAINFLVETRRVAPIHFIKLSRDLAQTIKTTFVKSLQDFYRYKDCTKCSSREKLEASNDVQTLLGIFQFIIEGLGPIEHNGSTVKAALHKFFELNQEGLKTKLFFYTQHE